MTTHPVCPAHESVAKVCESPSGIAYGMDDEEASVTRACAAAILAFCQSSGCAERWAKGLELAREIREKHRQSVDAKGSWCFGCADYYGVIGCDAIRLADHLEGR